MSNVQKNYYERDKLQHENEARKVNLCTYYCASNNFISKNFTVNKETFFSPVMGPNFIPKKLIYTIHINDNVAF
jgi:hypothetical protein